MRPWQSTDNDTQGAASLAGGQLTVDLGALTDNYLALAARALPARTAAVVKADAYGLGVQAIVPALLQAGCRDFFVAHLGEGLPLRTLAPDAAIYVLNGLFPGVEEAAACTGMVPVINSMEQLQRWWDLAISRRQRLPAILQFDTGMSRLGLTARDAAWLAANPVVFDDLEVRYLMTHFASADAPSAAANVNQRDRFRELTRVWPRIPVTLANSAALLANRAARGDLVRPGLALYGGAPVQGATNPMRPVVGLTGRIIQLRTIAAGTGVGYGLTFTAEREMRIATVGVGYGDGWPRALGGRGAVYFGDARLPIIGRVSMDSMMVDASAAAAGEIQAGDLVELIGPRQSLDDVAETAGTISYEILTRLDRRLARLYVRS